ncbi:Nitrogen permease regulator 2 [Rhodotorula kratochvilovae]
MVSRREQLRQESGSYTPKLVACFYAVFDPTLGPRVVHQIPEGSVATALSTFPSRPDTPKDPSVRTTLSPPREARGRDDPASPIEPVVRANPVLFDFASIIDFVIPKPELCGHLITKATRTNKILGFPIRIVDEEKYHGSKAVYNRNAFIFNVCFVFERDAELSVYEPVARKTGRTLCAMEEQFSLLSSPPPAFSMANLLEQLYLDLNAYFETSIPLIDTTLDLVLYPFYANPPEVRIWEVPIAVTDLEQMKSYSWDVTLYKLCSFINGVNHVKRIAELAEVDLFLARQCIQHLVYYNAVIMVDLFQFSNSYAVLPDIADAAQYGEDDDESGIDLRTECENYVRDGTRDSTPVPFATLLSFYSRLKPGYPLHAWMDDLGLDALPLDVRRMVQFGVIKGFLRRAHACPVWLDHPALRGRRERASADSSGAATATGRAPPPPVPQGRRTLLATLDAPAPPQHSTTSSLAPSRASPPPPGSGSGDTEEDGGGISYPPSLALLLDGTHHTDEVCLRYGIGWRTLEAVLRDLGGGGRGMERGDDGEESGEGEGREAGGGGEYGERVVMLWT